jgi:retinol dehydrogenase-12
MLFIVLNVLFVRELTKRLPANSPIIVTSVNPGFCKTQLARHVPFATRLSLMIMAALLSRTAEQGSRNLVWAAVGGAGREFELRGAFVNMADIKEVSDYVLSEDGAVAQRRIWVRYNALW